MRPDLGRSAGGPTGAQDRADPIPPAAGAPRQEPLGRSLARHNAQGDRSGTRFTPNTSIPCV